jgi:CheY-like chemotaxis protein
MEAIGTLAGGVAHDFNNLLTVIIGNAQLALMDVIKDQSLRKEIGEIKKAGDRAASLTRQLLAFSRKQLIRPEVMDINEVIDETEKMLKRLIGEDIEFQTVLEPELWKVHADPGQIDQVIMNLAVNARDVMPQGGKLTIETANVDLDENYLREHGIEETPGPYVILAVSNTGSGMDKETQEHIFEPFFTTKGVGKGTGLGLSTVYGIVKQNNGFAWVYSEPGQGSTFKVYLPKAEGDADSEEKQRLPVIELGGSETVLIVEDDEGLRKFAQEVLQQHGYKVLDAENGEDALRVSQAHEGPIHLMITDVVMPKMGGKEAAERLQPFYPRMKVIYMSGYTDNAIVHHGVPKTFYTGRSGAQDAGSDRQKGTLKTFLENFGLSSC